jgi:hypothetical protein
MNQCKCFIRHFEVTDRLLRILTKIHYSDLASTFCEKFNFLLDDMESEMLKRQNTTMELPK